MAAGLVDTSWKVEDIVALIEKAEAEASPKSAAPPVRIPVWARQRSFCIFGVSAHRVTPL
jgi:hypothetical protein